MFGSLSVATPPAAEPVTLAMAKLHLRVTISNDDTLLTQYLQSSRELVESESGRSLVNKLYVQAHDRFPHRDEWQLGSGYTYRAPRYSHMHGTHRLELKLLRSPLVNVQKIEYIAPDSTTQTLFPTPDVWRAKTEYDIGDQVADSNGNLQEVSAVNESETGGASISGANEPSPWSSTLNATTTDGDLTWTCKQIPAPAGDFIEDRVSEPPRLLPLWGQVWPLTLRVPNAVKVFFVAGYGNDGADAPASLKVAVMQGTGVSYENREALTPGQLRDMPWYDRLIMANRVMDYSPTR